MIVNLRKPITGYAKVISQKLNLNENSIIPVVETTNSGAIYGFIFLRNVPDDPTNSFYERYFSGDILRSNTFRYDVKYTGKILTFIKDVNRPGRTDRFSQPVELLIDRLKIVHIVCFGQLKSSFLNCGYLVIPDALRDQCDKHYKCNTVHEKILYYNDYGNPIN